MHADNVYNNLENDEDTTPQQYKQSWMLDSAASGNYGDHTTYIRNASKIKRGTGISVGCANNHGMAQTGQGEIPFDRIPPAASDVQTFDDMNAPLLSTGKLVRDGDAIVIMDKPDAHVITGNTKTTIQNIVTIATTTNPDDIMLKVPFNERSLTWRTVGNDDTGSIFHGSITHPHKKTIEFRIQNSKSPNSKKSLSK